MICLLRAIMKKMPVDNYVRRKFQTSDGTIFEVQLIKSDKTAHYYINNTRYFTVSEQDNEPLYFTVYKTAYTLRYNLNTFLFKEHLRIKEWAEINYNITPEEYFQYEIIHKNIPSLEHIKYISSISYDIMKYNTIMSFEDVESLKKLLKPYDHITLIKEKYVW